MADEPEPEIAETSTLMDNAAMMLSPLNTTAKSVGHDHCLVCYSELDYTAIAPCGHNDVCGVCHLRLRHLHSDRKCPMCKTVNEQLVVDDPSLKKSFQDYPIWGNELGDNFAHRSDVGMFFPKDYYELEILPLFGYYCTEPECPYDGTTPDPNIYEQADPNKQKPKKKKHITPLRALQDHLRNKHRLTLCELCVEFRRDFVSLLPRFSPSQLKRHLSKGDGPQSGFKGHPLCEFCRPKRFYDLTQLYQHLAKDHYKCHVCDKQGLPNQYFRDYPSLEKHFDRQHFLCPDPQCLAARFVVFENEIDFRAHERNTHGGSTTGGSTKIQLEFRIRRAGHDGSGYDQQQEVPTDQDFQYGLDGQAFVPEALPQQAQRDQQQQQQQGNEETWHPLHLQRTAELRAHAAQLRRERDMAEAPDAFPSLQEGNNDGTAGNLRVGWSGEDVRQRLAGPGGVRKTEENFPALPGGDSRKKKAPSVAGKLKSGGGVPGGRSFAAMRSAAMGVTPGTSSSAAASGASWGGVASSAAAAAPAAPSFPPLSSSSTAPTVAASVARVNRESDLTPDNFPSLGGSTTPSYPAIDRLARKPQSSAPPSLSSSSDFPPPPTASNKNSVRNKMIGEQKAQAPSRAALDNVLDFPPPSSTNTLAEGKATVEQMKAVLGTAKYKQLKNLTKEFAADALSPEAYVDHAASLFESGYADRDFLSFVPSLLASCPNKSAAQQATRYLEQIRRQQYQPTEASKPAAALQTTATSNSSSSGWSAPPKVTALPNSGVAQATSVSGGWASATVTSNRSRPAGVATPATSYKPSVAVSGGKKGPSAWGTSTSGPSAVMRAKATPGSVSVAAAQEGPQSGTATKFMAKESKQQQQDHEQKPKSSKSESKKKKKKEKDELRSLAFGR